MAVIQPYFLSKILSVHEKIKNGFNYPFFDPACVYYEALRAKIVDNESVTTIIDKYGISHYQLSKCHEAFFHNGIVGLLCFKLKHLIEELSRETERMIYVLKQSRPSIPATKMVTILRGFNCSVDIDLMRHTYASYGWALGTRTYTDVDFLSLNLKVITLLELKRKPVARKEFFVQNDRLQQLLETFRTIGTRGITKRFYGSRVSFALYKKEFLTLGLLGLLEKSRTPFRNSKVGFHEEGLIILSKIQNREKKETYYRDILLSKGIKVVLSCITNIFTRWNVNAFESKFVGDLKRLSKNEDCDLNEPCVESFQLPDFSLPIRVDKAFISFMKQIEYSPVSLANPGIFIFLPYINRLRLFEKASLLMDVDPDRGYSWFSLLLLNMGRIMEGISSITKSCRTHELSLPLSAALVTMPCNDSVLNGLATISEEQLLQLRKYLTSAAKHFNLIKGENIAFDFKMRDFTGDDISLKNIGKGPSAKRKICFPGFRPHVAWDVDTGTPISIEFRNGKARATTTLKRYITELLTKSLGGQCVERVYLDSEYTAEHIWKFIVDENDGLGADLTMCIKQNKRVKKYINAFLDTHPQWIYYDDEHIYTEQSFKIPIQDTDKILFCVLKKKKCTGALRCFGSTIEGLDSLGILKEYRSRWSIENGIKDLCTNYFLDNIPSIDPHRINIHYFIVTLCRIIYEMFCQDFNLSLNPDGTKRGIDALRLEFIIGSNATLSKNGNLLIVKWIDHYTQNVHDSIAYLFEKLNEEMKRGLPFLGGMKIKFEIVPPKSNNLKNELKRQLPDF